MPRACSKENQHLEVIIASKFYQATLEEEVFDSDRYPFSLDMSPEKKNLNFTVLQLSPAFSGWKKKQTEWRTSKKQMRLKE